MTPLAVVCAAIFLACASGSAALATTEPGVVYVKKLIITNEKILIGRTRRTMTDRVQRSPRGAFVRYEVRNRGTRPFLLNILCSSTGTLSPGQGAPILIGWTRRGNFTFRAVPGGPRMRVVVY